MTKNEDIQRVKNEALGKLRKILNRDYKPKRYDNYYWGEDEDPESNNDVIVTEAINIIENLNYKIKDIKNKERLKKKHESSNCK